MRTCMDKIRILSLLLVLLLALPALASCASYDKGDTTVLMTVGGREVTAETFRYVCLKNAVYLFGEKTDAQTLTAEQKKELEKAVLSELRRYYAVETLAGKHGVSLGKEDKNEIKDQIKESRKSYEDPNEYYAAYGARYMTENVFYEQTVNYYLERDLFDYISEESSGVIFLSDEDLKKDVRDHFYAALQILRSNKNDRELLSSLRERALAGEDFETLAKEYSDDKKKSVRYFTEGEMQPFFEEAVKELEIGGIGEIVESDLGLHLIQRCPIDEEYLDAHLEEFRYSDLVRIYNGMIEEEAAGLEIVYTEKYTGLILT